MVGFRKAERRKAKLRLAIAGPSGSGKTASSLLIAYGLTGDWSKIGLVDTENGSGELYVNSVIGGVQIGEYNVLTLEAPYTPEKYINAIKLAEKEGIEALILDSASHAWAGEGGLLDQQGKIADRGGNSFAAWRQVTPKHNQFVEAMLTSKLHLLVTLRSKTEYIQTQENGKTVVKKVGLAPVQRDGFEYEFTVFLELAADHTAAATKDRTSLLDGQYFRPTPEIGKTLLHWLENGFEPVKDHAQDLREADIFQNDDVSKQQAQGDLFGLPPQNGKPPNDKTPICTGCGTSVTKGVKTYSEKYYGQCLCQECQQAVELQGKGR